jgi:hypothetical protein
MTSVIGDPHMMASIPLGAIMNIDRHICGPNVAFHFTSLDTAAKYILPTLNLKFGSIKNTNDPKEYTGVDPAIERHGGASSDYILKVARNRFSNRAFRNVKCICLCRNSNRVKSYLKLRMWAQYGDNSKGVCIALDIKSLKPKLAAIPTKIWQGNIRYNNLIAHRKEDTHILILDADNLSEVRSQVDSHVEQIIKHGYFKKHKDFRDESEYRIIASTNKPLFLDISDSILSVIVGPKVSDMECQRLLSSCPKNIEVQKLSWYPHGATLDMQHDPYHRLDRSIAMYQQRQMQ